jgi:hypothetical protein
MTLLGDINYSMLFIIGSWMVRLPWQLTSLWQLLVIPLLVISIALSLIGLYIMNRSNLRKVRTGSALVLLASVIAFPTMFDLLFGPFIVFVGSILGLV